LNKKSYRNDTRYAKILNTTMAKRLMNDDQARLSSYRHKKSIIKTVQQLKDILKLRYGEYCDKVI